MVKKGASKKIESLREMIFPKPWNMTEHFLSENPDFAKYEIGKFTYASTSPLVWSFLINGT
jgi:hypothetical protein